MYWVYGLLRFRFCVSRAMLFKRIIQSGKKYHITPLDPPAPPPPLSKITDEKKTLECACAQTPLSSSISTPRPSPPALLHAHTQPARTGHAGVSFTGAPVGRFSLRRARSLDSAWPISWTACPTADSAPTVALGRRQGPAAPLR